MSEKRLVADLTRSCVQFNYMMCTSFIIYYALLFHWGYNTFNDGDKWWVELQW